MFFITVMLHTIWIKTSVEANKKEKKKGNTCIT